MIFSAIGVDGGEKVVGCIGEDDESLNERSIVKRDLPIAGTVPATEPVLSMRSRCFREDTLFVRGGCSTGVAGKGNCEGGSGARDPGGSK